MMSFNAKLKLSIEIIHHLQNPLEEFPQNNNKLLPGNHQYHSNPITELFKAMSKGLGDLKESPSLGESSHVMFSRMAKYSSLTAFYTFSEQQPKATEDKVCLHQS